MGKYPNKTVEEMERILIQIIQITVPRFTIQSVAEYSISIEELYLCCLLAFLYQKYGEKEKSKILLENLLLFVEHLFNLCKRMESAKARGKSNSKRNKKCLHEMLSAGILD